jgi:hypothetical protein
LSVILFGGVIGGVMVHRRRKVEREVVLRRQGSHEQTNILMSPKTRHVLQLRIEEQKIKNRKTKDHGSFDSSLPDIKF